MALLVSTTIVKKYICFEDEDVIEKEITLKDTYACVGHLEGDKNKQKINLVFYKDNTKSKVLECKKYSFAPSVENGAENFVRQAYCYLKTLPEFADAVDC